MPADATNTFWRGTAHAFCLPIEDDEMCSCILYHQSGIHNPNLEALLVACAGVRDLHGLRFGSVASEAGVTISILLLTNPKQLDDVCFYVGIPNMSEYLTRFFSNTVSNLSSIGPTLAVNEALAYELAYYSFTIFPT